MMSDHSLICQKDGVKKAGRHWRPEIKGHVGDTGETTEESRHAAETIPLDSAVPGFPDSWSVPRGFHLDGRILPTLHSRT